MYCFVSTGFYQEFNLVIENVRDDWECVLFSRRRVVFKRRNEHVWTHGVRDWRGGSWTISAFGLDLGKDF